MLLGSSPGVITEAAWELCANPDYGYEIDRVEVWTTAPDNDRAGRQKLEAFLRGGLWRDLQQALKEHGAKGSLPDLRPEDIRLLGEPGAPLEDIRSQEDNRVMIEQICERVRQIKQEEDEEGVRLLASLAGGRKTMSAALQTACELYAEEGDKLLHVLLHPEVERHPKWFDFAFPTPQWRQDTGLAFEDMIDLYEVQFPRLRYLLQVAKPKLGQTTSAALMEEINLWLRAQQPIARATLTEAPTSPREASIWTLELYNEGHQDPLTVSLSDSDVFFFCAGRRLADEEGDIDYDKIFDAFLRFKKRGQRTAEQIDTNNSAFRKALSRYKARFKKHPVLGKAAHVLWAGNFTSNKTTHWPWPSQLPGELDGPAYIEQIFTQGGDQ
jgi:CRISPR-associated protein (TIGR02584 family)